MRPDRADQAEGLRRLLVRNKTQVINVVAGKSGVGCTSASINLAVALAGIGKDVLVLDENQGPDNLSSHLGLHDRHDLLDVVQKRCSLKDAVLSTSGFTVMPTARAMRSLATLKHAEQQRLESALAEVSNDVDVMLVDAAMPIEHAPLSSSLASGSALLVVVDTTATGITKCYSLIKRLALKNARLQFDILVNKAADEQTAVRVFENLAKVSWQNFSARLEYLGYVPHDVSLKRAMQLGRSVIGAFPGAASAQSYLAVSQKLLHLPIHHDETGDGARTIMQGLIRQVTPSLHRYSRDTAYVVN